jgi:hypothetical protein
MQACNCLASLPRGGWTKQPLRLPAQAMLDKFLRSLKMRNFKSQPFLSTKNLCIVFFMTADYACERIKMPKRGGELGFSKN